MKVKNILIGVFGVLSVFFIVAGSFYFVYLRPIMNQPLKTIAFDKQLTIVTGAGGNSGILVSDSLVLVVDTKMGDATKQFCEQVKQLAGNKPIVIVNTHVHTDHVSGNSLFKGQTIIAGGNYEKDFWIAENGAGGLPTQWVKDSLVLQVGDETVTILNLGFAAHTQSDVLVYLHNRKLIFTGDVVLNKQSPALFAKYKASSAGYLAAFDLMQKRFDIKTVVPGHGDIGGPEVIDNYRQFFVDMKAVAANAPGKAGLLQKYQSWRKVPFLMSPHATAKFIQGETAGN